MKPHPRIRKMIKWGGAVVTVLLVVVWVGSGWWSLQWGPGRGLSVMLRSGEFCLAVPHDSSRAFDPGFHLSAARGRFFHWRFRVDNNPWWWELDVPLWAPAGVSIVLGAAAWRLDQLSWRRARVGRCAACNYDRTGLAVGAVCPECGAGAGDARVGSRG